MKMNIKRFEDLTVDELYDIIKLRLEVFSVEQNCVYNDLDNNDKKAYHIYCTNDAGDIIATMRIADPHTRFEEVSVGRIVVKKECRKEGIAGRMINFAILFIKEVYTTKKIMISAQSRLLSFYESLGFVKNSSEYMEDDIPHIEMFYEIK
ncbi:MAG: GNAT family N-acetyltransferase [Clostridia bacterium]